MRERVATP